MWSPKFFVFLCVALVAAQSNSTAAVLVRDVAQNVTFQGFSVQGTEQFQGIKYGQDTSGPNRFKPPQAFTYPAGVTVLATAAGAACPQNTAPSLLGITESPDITSVSEDCLTLKIVRPAGTVANENLPVMIWIFGEGDESGSYNTSLYDPTNLVASSVAKGSPIIFVAMNYRVNVFGFANSPALRAEGSLNAGLLDQRMAIDWVQTNIASFGGNPRGVTLFGQSDGAVSAGLHLTSNGGNGTAPFRAVALQSGGPAGDPGVSGNTTLVNTATVAQLAGCTGSNDTQIVTCLRQIPGPLLLQAVLQFETSSAAAGTAQDIFFPTVDGRYIPDAPSTLLRNGRYHKQVSVIAGFNEDDGSTFTPPTLNGSAAVSAYVKLAYPGLTNATVSRLISLYPLTAYTARAQAQRISPFFYQAAQIYRDINFACPAIEVSHRVAASGAGTYLYVLNSTSLASVLAFANASFEGVIHLSDVPYVFNRPNVGFGFASTAADNVTATRMSGAWIQLATTGSPSSNNTVTTFGTWPKAFTAAQAAITSQNVTGAAIRVIGGPKAGNVNLTLTGDTLEPGLLARCEFINSPAFYAQLQT